ncbi:RNA pseudouridine synthase [Iodidimonas muriae]|uniref:RNA pseudouridine synthase n=1 Tax=Iodidimonas muriae TaxID=261467 RepID=A0ABQ2L995_9PROT|nr:RNA pseudouridine synthase [Iodidimonas muriae]GER08170.1 RNA pseudouridine synthase [Kordiimonadales bacterium JCM 17843]GGO06317.1 RNA pseudouridine synthase [Iodidimonas muriae]
MLDLAPLVLFHDQLIIVLNKPAGIPVHVGPSGKDCLEDYFDQIRFGLPRLPALAHRLDADTSGCLVLGRHPKALRRLGRIFSQGQAQKTYLAITKNRPEQTEGRIDLPLLKVSSKAKGWRMQVDEAGKPSITEYRVLGGQDGRYLLEMSPLTGRTHQIRVHLAALGCPILGEPKYADRDQDESHLHLHSRRIRLPLYANKGEIDVIAPLPKHFEKALNRMALGNFFR